MPSRPAGTGVPAGRPMPSRPAGTVVSGRARQNTGGMHGPGESSRDSGGWRSAVSAARSVGRGGARAGNGAKRAVRRLTRAGGAGGTGVANRIERSAASSVGDAFVAVALAGTLFFSASVDQARGRVALALLITIAPFAVLAPFIGPLLDRVQQGRRFILAGTLLARG